MTYLLDVNVLVALLWKPHAHHEAAVHWLESHTAPWATSPFTEAGFVRIVSTPAFSRGTVRPERAMTALYASTSSSRHEFWPADQPFVGAVRSVCGVLRGPKQVTDAYLLGLAASRGGKLATFDQAIPSLVAEDYRAASPVEVITWE